MRYKFLLENDSDNICPHTASSLIQFWRSTVHILEITGRYRIHEKHHGVAYCDTCEAKYVTDNFNSFLTDDEKNGSRTVNNTRQ